MLKKKYITPGGTIYNQYKSMLDQTHLLIAGTTGSGKSVLTNNLILTALHYGPVKYSFVFVDSKKLELYTYRKLPHCLKYCDTYQSIANGISYARVEMEYRFNTMRKKGLYSWPGGKIIVVIDEYVDISLNLKRSNKKLYKRIDDDLTAILSRGRAAGIMVILCTQRPTSDVITGIIKANLPAQVALHTANDQESRNIIGIPNAAKLPKHGKCLYYTPDTMRVNIYDVPLLDDLETQRILDHWKYQNMNVLQKFIYKLFKSCHK